MYATQCVPFDRCKLAIPISLENSPSLKKIPTSLKPKDERTCCNVIIDVALIFF